MAVEDREALKAVAARLLPCLDLTSLNDDDTPDTIAALCRRAVTPFGKVAAVCVWPRFVAQAHELLSGTGVRVATVVNFPHGTGSPREVEPEIERAVDAGADEIDMVRPLGKASNGRFPSESVLCRMARRACGGRPLKIILETGMLQDKWAIFKAASVYAGYGANFLKTSTGKIKVGATLGAAKAILYAIRGPSTEELKELLLAREQSRRSEEDPKITVSVVPAATANAGERRIGFKASGGIRTVAQAKAYVDLAERIMGPDYVRPATFRIGASGLLDDILALLEDKTAAAGSSGY